MSPQDQIRLLSEYRRLKKTMVKLTFAELDRLAAIVKELRDAGALP